MGKQSSGSHPDRPKYQQIYDQLARDIASGKYKPGQKLPSEAALVRKFDASRITVGRAVRDLKQDGLVDRIAGSGTFVRGASGQAGAVFGLLIPDLGETEIFEPICRGIAGAPQASSHALLWGRTQAGHATRDEQALSLLHQFIERKVAGVFFAPLERTAGSYKTNEAIATDLEKAGIPIVLLDRCYMPFPKRSTHDLVGIDNRRAGYLIAEHLLKLGCRQIVFIACSGGTSTVEARIAGFREALFAYGVAAQAGFVQRPESIEEGTIKRLIDELSPEAFICVNDRTAGMLMPILLKLGCRIPRDVRVAGIDDVEYARLLPVPLTTIHQPCREIGNAAMGAMLDRIEHPNMLARDILLDCHLVVRDSCGGAL
jgi:GntR family transcriptional regulator of arabinose operon